VNFSRCGFTIMELVLVIFLLGVTALTFVTYTGSLSGMSVDALAKKIQADIRLAQELATSTGRVHGVVFTANGNYVVYDGDESNPAIDPLKHTPMVENPSQFGSVHIANSYRVEFDKLGKPIVGGGGNVEIVSDDGGERRIYVIANTGAVVAPPPEYTSSCSCSVCCNEDN